MKRAKTLKLDENFVPCDVFENEEYYPNGVFVFNITRIIEHIQCGQLVVKQEDISVPDWHKTQVASIVINEEHIKTVTLEVPVIQAEISPGRFNIIDGSRLLVGCSGDPALKAVDLKTKQVSILAKLYPGAIMDGLQPFGDGRILFSDFNGHLFLLENTGQYREILNTTTIQANLADFEWIPEKKLLIIPGLYSNQLVAYRLAF
jgi:hypothetical protein